MRLNLQSAAQLESVIAVLTSEKIRVCLGVLFGRYFLRSRNFENIVRIGDEIGSATNQT